MGFVLRFSLKGFLLGGLLVLGSRKAFCGQSHKSTVHKGRPPAYRHRGVARPPLDLAKLNLSRCRKPILDGLTIAFANPAALLFYAAFFPQFIDPDRSISDQMLVLSALYVCTAMAFDSACVLTFGRFRFAAGWTQIARFAKVGSAAVYLSIAVITVLGFIETSA